MTPEYTDLSELKSSPGYQRLQAEWAAQGKKILDALNKASREKGKDDSLRYYAGMWFGFDAAVGQLERALEEIQRKLGNENESGSVDKLLEKLSERKPQ